MPEYLREAIVVAGTDTGIKIKDLRIAFKVTRSIEGFPNALDLDIYNLNRSTQTRFQKEFTRIFLFAGYRGNVKMIFSGNIKNVAISTDGVNTITKVFAGDADVAFLTSTFSGTFKPKTKLVDIVVPIARTFKGTTIGTLNGLDNPFLPLRATTFSGKSSDLMTALGISYDFDWKFDNNVISTIARTKTLDTTGILVSAETGLLDAPVITERGVNIRTLLNPSYIPRGQVKIDTSQAKIQSQFSSVVRLIRRTANGVFPIAKVTHIGDTHGVQWTSSLELLNNFLVLPGF